MFAKQNVLKKQFVCRIYGMDSPSSAAKKFNIIDSCALLLFVYVDLSSTASSNPQFHFLALLKTTLGQMFPAT